MVLFRTVRNCFKYHHLIDLQLVAMPFETLITTGRIRMKPETNLHIVASYFLSVKSIIVEIFIAHDGFLSGPHFDPRSLEARQVLELSRGIYLAHHRFEFHLEFSENMTKTTWKE